MRRRSRIPGSGSGAGSQLDGSCCVAEVMGTELFTLTPDTVVGSALRLATAKRVRHFLVIEEGSLTGIVCQEDLRLARESALVGECMSSPVLCIGPETTLKEAADIMVENAVSCLPVVTGAFLVGVITREKLDGMGVPVQPEVEMDDEEVRVEPIECAACGATEQVRKDYRCGLIPLCKACAAVIPSTEPSRGN